MLLVRKVFKWFLISLGCLLIVIAVGGRIYQVISESQDLARFPAPGKLVNVDGHLMHIHCQGQGSPTVVVEQGLQGVSSAWEEIHQQIALVTKVCVVTQHERDAFVGSLSINYFKHIFHSTPPLKLRFILNTT